jgi:hypothetical protein
MGVAPIRTRRPAPTVNKPLQVGKMIVTNILIKGKYEEHDIWALAIFFCPCYNSLTLLFGIGSGFIYNLLHPSANPKKKTWAAESHNHFQKSECNFLTAPSM